jgi:LPS export ABC transporter protein LptC
MLAWQKRARWAVLVIAFGVVAVVFATTRRRETPPPPAPAERVDPAAIIESSGAQLSQLKGENETVRIESEHQLSYPDGSIRMLKAKVTSIREGRTFVAISDEARVGEDQTNLEMKGHVRLQSSEGLDASAQTATYNKGEGIVRAPGPVTFKNGRLSGSGVDFSYDETRDLMGISDQSKVRIEGDKKTGTSPVDITSGSSVLSRADNFVSFERAVHIVKGAQVIDADSALGELTGVEGENEYLRSLELQGSSRIESPAAAAGELRQMTGDVINLTYKERSDLLESATLSGNSGLKIAGDKNAADRELHAQNMEIGMAPNGTTVTSLNARDHVVLDLPGAKDQPAKRVSSNVLVASGTEKEGLTAASFTEGVEYVETGGTPPVKRTVRSRTLDTALNGGLGDIREANFIGQARFNDATTNAASSSMQYNMQTGQVVLKGEPGQPVPRVVNEQMQVDANEIEMNIEGSRLKATSVAKPVQSIMFPVKPGSSSTRRQPGLMKQDQPVNGLSRELLYTGGDGSTVELSGAATLVQGEKADTQVKADKITLEGKTGNLLAQGSVISRMVVQDLNPESKERETVPSVGSGQQMNYEDAARKVTYTTKAHVVGPHGDLIGETIVLFLGENGQDIDRLEAAGEVKLTETERITTGDQLVYVADKEEYTMSGKNRLVRMFQNTDKGCRRTDGDILTFSRGTDSLKIQGREQTRTQTASDNSCPQPAKR